MKVSFLFIFLITFATFTIAADKPSIKSIEKTIKKYPKKPLPYYKKCQWLFKNGKEEEAIAFSKITIESIYLCKR